MTRAGHGFSFLVVLAAGRSHRGPEHHWTGGHVRATCSEASRPLGALGSPPAVWGVGWDLLPSQGRPSCMAWDAQVPLLCLAKALSLSPSGFLLGLPRSLPTFRALPSPAEGPEPALCWRMPTWCPCCYCPCCGGVSGGGWGTGLTAWGGGHAWGGAGAAAEPLCPPGSLQEFPGYELQVQESVVVKACMDVHVPCSFSYPWNSGYPWYSSGELFIYWFREKDPYTNDVVATNDRRKRVKPETQGRFSLRKDPSNDCSLSIREARLSDSGVYYFRVERGPNVKYNYRDKKLNLQVTGMTGGPGEDPGPWRLLY